MRGGIISTTKCPATEQAQSFQSAPLQKCLIALGGNLHNSRRTFNDALVQLQHLGCSDVETSRLKRTRPMGLEAGGDFLNAAAVLQTDQSPLELLKTLHDIETMFGRTRTQHWGPRILDLDLILYGDVVSNVPELVVPHPAMWYRRFVLDPAVEVAAEMVHPILGESITQLRDRLLHRPLALELCADGSLAQTAFCDEIPNSLHDMSSDLQWCAVEAEDIRSPDAFARITVRVEQPRSRTQTLNPAERQVVVTGATMAEILSQIQQLKTAMLG